MRQSSADLKLLSCEKITQRNSKKEKKTNKESIWDNGKGPSIRAAHRARFYISSNYYSI